MGSALKLFSKKSLLEIESFQTNVLRTRFREIADVLLNQSLIAVANNTYRICEIEFYAHSRIHQDPYTHRHPEQLKFGSWYFHQIKTKSGYSFKGGKYKGLDLTLGNGNCHLGILIRSIESTTSGERIDGPSLVVDEILNCLKAESVSSVATSMDCDLLLISDLSLDFREFILGPRVGLKPKLEGNSEDLDFLFKPSRYITQPSKTKNGKALLFLHQMNSFGWEKAIELVGIRESEAKKYLNWFENGHHKKLSDLLFDDKIEDQCTFFGAYCSQFNSNSSNDSTIEVTPEQLHEMAVMTLREGDYEQLKYLCDIGIEACGCEGIGVEFFKLRGIYYAQKGDIAKARYDFLSVLEVNPADEVAFTNYITACLDAEDPSPALQAVKMFYPAFDGKSKSRVLESIKEAIKVRTLSVEGLPETVIADLAIFMKIKKDM